MDLLLLGHLYLYLYLYGSCILVLRALFGSSQGSGFLRPPTIALQASHMLDQLELLDEVLKPRSSGYPAKQASGWLYLGSDQCPKLLETSIYPLYTYIRIHTLCMYIGIYICRYTPVNEERERERERDACNRTTSPT